MAGFETFERDLKLASAGLTGAAFEAELARFAKSELQRVIRSGEGSPIYETYVNGRRGVAEEAVIAPGPILYVFANWPLIIRTALAELVKRVPVKSGRYASGFVVLADGKIVRNYADITPRQVVTIFNVQPYTRKMEVGANRGGKHHFRKVRQAMFRRFGQQMFDLENSYISPPAGIHPLVPYTLKGRSRLIRAATTNLSSAYRAGRTTLAPRKATSAGQKLTYPSLVFRMIG
jgi:hypothetical protein